MQTLSVTDEGDVSIVILAKPKDGDKFEKFSTKSAPDGARISSTPMATAEEDTSFSYGKYTFTWDEDGFVVTPAVEPLQRPLYSHEYTFGNFITNGERDQSNNMKAAYITVGGTVQVFKENTTAGKWVTVPNENNLALMDAPLTAFESGPPSDFQYQGFVFTFSAGDVDGYTVAPALSII